MRAFVIVLVAGLATGSLGAVAPDAEPQGMGAAAKPPAQAEFAGPSNAALVYYRVWMITDQPKLDAVVKEQDPAPLPELQPTIEGLMAGAAIARCDWGVEYDQGPFALLPHLGKLRDSARLLKADATRLLGEGDAAGAVDRVEAMLRMSRQLEKDRVVISALVGASISIHACEAAGALVDSGRLAPEDARRLLEAAKLGVDPFGAHAALRAEGVVFIDWAREHLTGRDAGRQLARLISLGEPDDSIETLLKMDGAQVGQALDTLKPFYEEAVALFDDPNPVERMQALERRLEEGEFGPVAKVLAPSVHKMRGAIDKAVAQRQSIVIRLEQAAR